MLQPRFGPPRRAGGNPCPTRTPLPRGECYSGLTQAHNLCDPAASHLTTLMYFRQGRIPLFRRIDPEIAQYPKVYINDLCSPPEAGSSRHDFPGRLTWNTPPARELWSSEGGAPFVGVPLSLSRARAHACVSRCRSLSHSHTLTLSHSHTHTLSHTHTPHTLTLTLSTSYTRTLSHSLTLAHSQYRGTSLIRKRQPLGPDSRPMPRALCGPGGGAFSCARYPCRLSCMLCTEASAANTIPRKTYPRYMRTRHEAVHNDAPTKKREYSLRLLILGQLAVCGSYARTT